MHLHKTDVAVLERRQDASAADAHLIAEACLRAADEVGLSKEELGAIVGRHRTSLERSGLPPQSKEGQLGLLFLRVMRSLDALMGSDPELMRYWLEQPNHHLGEQPPSQLLASVEGLARVAAYLDAMRA
ncbi:MAG: hypothetical protein ACI9IO_002499 [Cyanobium sp.]